MNFPIDGSNLFSVRRKFETGVRQKFGKSSKTLIKNYGFKYTERKVEDVWQIDFYTLYKSDSTFVNSCNDRKKLLQYALDKETGEPQFDISVWDKTN